MVVTFAEDGSFSVRMLIAGKTRLLATADETEERAGQVIGITQEGHMALCERGGVIREALCHGELLRIRSRRPSPRDRPVPACKWRGLKVRGGAHGVSVPRLRVITSPKALRMAKGDPGEAMP